MDTQVADKEISKLKVVVNQLGDGSIQILNLISQSSILIDSDFTNAFGHDQRKQQSVKGILDKLRTSQFSELPISLRLAMSSALGLPLGFAPGSTGPAKPFKYYDTSFLQDDSKCTPCTDTKRMKWALCNYKSLRNDVERGDNVEFLNLESSVYLVRDYNAARSVGEMDPAADVRMRSLIWVTSYDGSALGDMVLVLRNEYIWKRQYLNEIDPKGKRIAQLLCSKTVHTPLAKTSSKVSDHILFSLRDHCRPTLTGIYHDASHGASYSDPFFHVGGRSDDLIIRLSSPIPSLQKSFLMEGIGAMLRTPTIHESHIFSEDELSHSTEGPAIQPTTKTASEEHMNPNHLNTAFNHRLLAEIPFFLLASAPKNIPCIVKRIERNPFTDSFDVVVVVLLDSQWINPSLMCSLGFHSVFTTNLEMRVPIHMVERTFVVSPALLFSSAAQNNSKARGRNYNEMFVVGHLDFVSSTGRKKENVLELRAAAEEVTSETQNEKVLMAEDIVSSTGREKENVLELRAAAEEVTSETQNEKVLMAEDIKTETQNENTCVLLSILEFFHMVDIAGPGLPVKFCGKKEIPVFRRTLPLKPAEILNLLAWRALNISVPGIGPSLDRYRMELAQSIENFARTKTSPRRKSTCNGSEKYESSPNTLTCRVPGRIVMGLIRLYLQEEHIESHFIDGMLCVRVNLQVELKKLIDQTIMTMIEDSGENSELVFDFNDPENNKSDGFVHLHLPVAFKWQMYPRFCPSIDRVIGPSEGICTITFHSFELRNVHKSLVTTNRFKENCSELLRHPH